MFFTLMCLSLFARMVTFVGSTVCAFLSLWFAWSPLLDVLCAPHCMFLLHDTQSFISPFLDSKFREWFFSRLNRLELSLFVCFVSWVFCLSF